MQSGHTFLAFVEDWRAGMVLAYLVRVCEYLAATLMDALLCHCERSRRGGIAEFNQRIRDGFMPLDDYLS